MAAAKAEAKAIAEAAAKVGVGLVACEKVLAISDSRMMAGEGDGIFAGVESIYFHFGPDSFPSSAASSASFSDFPPHTHAVSSFLFFLFSLSLSFLSPSIPPFSLRLSLALFLSLQLFLIFFLCETAPLPPFLPGVLTLQDFSTCD
jgi:hypothetical protein